MTGQALRRKSPLWHRRALTLPELLVVIGIIVILMTLVIIGAAKLWKMVESFRHVGK